MSDNPPAPLQAKIASDLPDPTNARKIQKTIRAELFELIKENSPEGIAILMATALYEPSDPYILEDCVFTLQILAKDNNEPAIDGLLTLAVIYSNEQAAAWLTSRKYQTKNEALLLAFKIIYAPKEPIEVNRNTYRLLNSLIFSYRNVVFHNKLFFAAQSSGLTHWVQLANFYLQPGLETSQAILNNFGGLNRQVQDLIVYELADHSKGGNLASGNLLCQIAIHYDNQNAWTKAIETNARPTELNDLAIFLFLSEKWDEYERLDFNGQIIVNAFNNSSENVRQKLLSLGRSSGKIDWLNQISGFSRSRWIGAITDADWHAAIEYLLKNNELNQLWKLSLSAPPYWSAMIMTEIGLQKFTPEHVSELNWEKIKTTAQFALKEQLPISSSSVQKTRVGMMSKAGISQDEKHLIISGQDQRITYFSLPELIEKDTLSSLSNHSIQALALSTDAISVGTDDSSIWIIRLSNQRILKNIQTHEGLIKSLLIDTENHFLYSSGFDKKIFLYHFPEGIVKESTRTEAEVFCLALVGKKRILACAEASGQISLFNGDNLEPLVRLAGHHEAVLFVSSTKEKDLLISYSRDRSLCVWNVTSRKLLNQLKSVEALIDLMLLTDGSAFLGLTDTGELILWNTSTMQVISRQKFKELNLKRIFPISKDDRVLGITSDSSIVKLNMSALKIYTQPLSETNNSRIQATKKQLNNSPQGSAWADYIDTIYTISHQHDIEIAEKKPISVGPFDIQL